MRCEGRGLRSLVLIAGTVSAGVGLLRGSPLPAQTVLSIPAPPGGPIAADLYGSGDRGVILIHGGRFDRTSWKAQAKQLAAAGFRTVAIDLRAGVESRAGHQTPCLYDETCLAKDVLATVRYLQETGVKSISLIGASLGGGAAAQAAAEAKAGEIDRVVLLAPTPIAAPEKVRARKLYLVARDDPGPSGTPRLVAIRKQYERAPGPKQLVIVDGDAHAQFLFETKEGARVMREILKFLDAP